MDIELKPRTKLRLIIDGVPISQEYDVKNEEAVPLSSILPVVSLIAQQNVKEMCEISRVEECPSYMVLTLSSISADEHISVQENDQAGLKLDQSTFLRNYSAQGLCLITFEEATLQNIFQSIIITPRLNHSDLIENIFLLTYPLVIKPYKSQEEYTYNNACSSTAKDSTSGYNLMVELSQVLFASNSQPINRLKLAEWEFSLLSLIRRWFVRYPEDINADILEYVQSMLAYFESGRFSDQLSELLAFAQRQANSKSSPASLLYSLRPQYSEAANFDLVRASELQESDSWPSLIARLRPEVISGTEYANLESEFKNLLFEDTPKLAIALSQYFAISYVQITARDLSSLACGVSSKNVNSCILRHNSLAKLIQLLVFDVGFDEVGSISEEVIQTKEKEEARSQLLIYLTYLTELLFELGCVEGVFCVVSAVQTEVCSRVLTEQQQEISKGFEGSGTYLDKFGKGHILAGIKKSSRIAECFFKDNKLLYQKYVPFFKNGREIFGEDQRIKPEKNYSINELEEMIKYNSATTPSAKQFENIEAFAWKLGKPVDALKLISMEGNYKNYRKYQQEKIRTKQCFIPYLGILNRDLVFICDGNPTFVDEDTKQIINFTKLQNVYNYIYDYLAPQTNFLGYCQDDAEAFFNGNIIARAIKNNNNSELINELCSFATNSEKVATEEEMWKLSKCIREKAIE